MRLYIRHMSNGVRYLTLCIVNLRYFELCEMSKQSRAALRGSTHREFVDLQGWLSDTHRDALPFFTAGADARV